MALLCFNLLNLQSPQVRAADDPADLQDDISSTQKKIEKTQQELEAAQALLNKNKVQVNTTKSLIVKTETTISKKEAEIESLKGRIALSREILAEYLRQAYYGDQEEPIIRLAIANDDLNVLLANADQLVSVKDRILGTLEEIRQSHIELEQVKQELAEQKEQHEKVLDSKLAEQGELKEDVQDAQTTLNQLSAKLDNLRTEYSRALGKSVSTKDIKEAAEFAAKATGMNKSFLLGVLVQESNKGQNVGGCNYKTSKMTATQLVAFKAITKELGYDYTKQKVSCPPKSYKGTGGAMGVPQFMPTTWQGYKSRIAALSGHNPPDPWSLVDGVVAMASKLSNDGASKKTRFAEAKSYCVYLAGGNWGYYCFGTDKYKKSYEDVNCWGTSIRNYGEKVLCLKDNYEKYY